MLIILGKDMDYEVIIHKQPDKFLMKLSKKNKDLLKYIVEGIDEIIENPYDFAILKGMFKGKRKKRKGSYSII